MIEEFCRTKIYDRCALEDPEPPLVTLRGRKKPQERLHPDFFSWTDRFTVYGKGVAVKMMNQPKGSPLRLAAGLFARTGDAICQPYIDYRYDGSWIRAISENESFNDLMTGFKDYFSQRRKRFMDKTAEMITDGVNNGTIKKRRSLTPSSHGGVANLLKVLTKTMHEQGSSIRTIAKVQYTICTQAGIFIPDEFITDVLVAADMVSGLWEADRKEKEKLNDQD